MLGERQAGATLCELLIVLTLAAMVMVAGAVATVPQIARASMRDTLHGVGTLVQAARTEAVARRNACRLVVDLSTHTATVVDTQGTTTTSDDVTLRSLAFPSIVSVARPDSGLPITFALASGLYHVEFDPGGHVSSGAGEMVLCSGGGYGRIVVYSAGGVRYQKWNGSSWMAGS